LDLSQAKIIVETLTVTFFEYFFLKSALITKSRASQGIKIRARQIFKKQDI
jgi:hypothetical protein